jgi:hypothetical protein
MALVEALGDGPAIQRGALSESITAASGWLHVDLLCWGGRRQLNAHALLHVMLKAALAPVAQPGTVGALLPPAMDVRQPAACPTVQSC